MGVEHNLRSDNQPNVWLLASSGDIEAIKMAIEKNQVSVNEQDENGYAILHAAASWNQPNLAHYLIQKGADVNIQDKDGDTPLHYVEDVEVAQILLDAGASPLVKNCEELLPIQTAFQDERHDIISLLKPISPENVELLTDQNDDIDNEEMLEQLMEMAQK